MQKYSCFWRNSDVFTESNICTSSSTSGLDKLRKKRDARNKQLYVVLQLLARQPMRRQYGPAQHPAPGAWEDCSTRSYITWSHLRAFVFAERKFIQECSENCLVASTKISSFCYGRVNLNDIFAEVRVANLPLEVHCFFDYKVHGFNFICE